MSAPEGGALAAKCLCWSCCDGSAVGQEASEAAGDPGQPHLPELEEVEVTERQQELWEKFGGFELDPVLGSGAVVLVDAEWVVERAGSGGTLEPRQALSPTAFMPHSGVKAATEEGEFPMDFPLLHIACVSHCWLQANHPDPHGHNLRILGRALQLLADGWFSNFTGRWAVFMDFICIHQNCRDHGGAPRRCTYQRLEGSECFEAGAIGRFEREHELFKEALGSLGSFYSHPATVVFMLTRFTDDCDNPRVYTRSGNTALYFDRGWCFCESSWAMLTKVSFLLVDLGQATGDENDYVESTLTGAAGRKAPALPDAFELELQSKGFTNGKDDRPRVAKLYRSAFAQRFESAERLVYTGLDWGDEEFRQVAAVLTSVALPRLQALNLSYNSMGDEGAAALAEALRAPGALPSLQTARPRWRRPSGPRTPCRACRRFTSPSTTWGPRARPRWRRPSGARAPCRACRTARPNRQRRGGRGRGRAGGGPPGPGRPAEPAAARPPRQRREGRGRGRAARGVVSSYTESPRYC
ncbi:unnamed protein product [Prorocentrum cordatum]|uniref:Uncharacterized protein n=1 Tax=Prorocentrum cordatum TaxID=2364126 RepID=A0ABN9V1Q2_9DINO|nr:unnamed protein product [Polarella glacialis]